MQQIFGGTTYMASNNLYQPNQRSRIIPIQQHVMDPPSYTKVLTATSFQSDLLPAFATRDPTSSGATAAHPTPYHESDIDSDTLLPPAFLVDWQKVTPLITVPELRQYIKLLGSFSNLMRHALKGKNLAEAGDDAQEFFSRASNDFDAWATMNRTSSNSARSRPLEAGRLPTLEVLMAWHAYTTNPRWYFEDGTRLGKLPPFPLELVTEFTDDDTLDFLPPSRIESVPSYVSPDPPAIARTSKFAQDLIAVARGDVSFLPGTVLLPSTGIWKGEDGAKLSQAFVVAIMGIDKCSILAAPDPKAVLCARLKGDIANAFSPPMLEAVRAHCRKGMNIEHSQVDARIARLRSAYSHEGLTSVDLVGEMRQQADFLGKMEALGWLAPGRFDGDVSRLFPLQKAAIRYHAFLHCKSQMPEGLACPTLDIELSWQMHQLKADSYVTDIQRLFKGQILDQSGIVNRPAALHAAYTPTAQAWSKSHGIPYSTCGCYTVKKNTEGSKKPMSMKERIKAKMNGATEKELTETSSSAYVATLDINEREASHPSSLEFHHRV